MIDEAEIRRLASQLSVPESQVRRDHLLSHLIRALPLDDRVVFIGGTALNRTHLPNVRLSEDLDVYLTEDTPPDLVDVLIEGVRLEFPSMSATARTRHHDVDTTVLEADGLRIQLQVISNRPNWLDLPKAATPVRLSYSDLPEAADLIVPTVDAFGAMKLTAYIDRAAARDLFDLAELAKRGTLGEVSLELVQQILGRSLVRQEFKAIPTDDQWNVELSRQVAEPGTPAGALETVVHALGDLLGW